MKNILSQIAIIAENEGISIGALERNIGASKGVLSRAIANQTDIQAKWLQVIVENYPNYNPEWLLSGVGSMLREVKKDEILDPVMAMLDPLAIKSCNPGKGIPLVSQQAVAGFGNGDFAIAEQDVKEYYIIPKFKYLTISFMIEVAGTSMYPKYNSGDIIACTIIRNSQFIQWNKCHVIATREQGILVKRIKRGDTADDIIAISDNKAYDPFHIPVTEITGIALVVGVIRVE